MVQFYQKEKKFEIYDSVLLDLKNFMTNLLKRLPVQFKEYNKVVHIKSF